MNSHLKIYGPLFKQEGTSRNERYLPALHPENITIDDRQLKDLLLYIQRLSGNLLFIGDGEENATGQGPAGRPKSWEDLLKKDPALLMASIAAAPVQELRKVYDLLELQSERQRKGGHFMRLVSHVFSVFKRLDEWHSAAAAEEVETRLKKDLQLYIQSYLARKLADLVQISLHARNLVPGEDIQGIKPATLKNSGKVWGELHEAGSHGVDLAFGERIFIGRDNEEKLINAASRLKEIFDTVMHVMTQVVNNCNAYLKETLHSKKDHQPHIALLITFLELYGYARDEINKIPQKHLNFYYEKVLGISARRAVADSVFLSLELEKGFDACELKKGTLFLAGKDKLNKNLFYGADKDIVVNKARIGAVRTLYLEKDRHRQVLQYYTDPAPGAVGGAGGSAAVAAGTRALFGDKAGSVTARAGFAIASDQLRLSGGERNIVLRFELAEDIIAGHFDAGIMELLLTGEKGWLSSENIADDIRINSISRADDKVLELNFTVGINQASAITGCKRGIHGDDFVTELPVLQCLLTYPVLPHDPDAAALNVYQNRIIQLNNLQKIRPVNTFITVGVGHVDVPASFDGVKALEVQNHEAILDAKKPFFPFTSIPKVGSSFYIGCEEIFCKPIQKLSLNIEWMLPDHFRTYYDKYLPPYDSNRFMASLSFLKKKKWRKINDISIIDVDSIDPRWRTIRIDYTKLKPVAEAQGEETGVARFDATKADGMLKLKLNYPDFGHGIYPQLITSSVMEKASSRQAAPDFFKIVEKQLHDSAISIKMPAGMEDKNGPFKVVVYQVAESNKTDEEAKVMMIKGMSSVIRSFNGSYTRPAGGSLSSQAAQDAEEAGQRVLVNDNNFIERVFGFLRKLRLMDKDTHHDKDKQSIGDTVAGVREKIESSASSILPADRELVGLIIDGTNSAIDQTVVKIVDRIIALRKEGISGNQVAAIVKEEIDEANDVINKMIARKIASVLLTHDIPAVPYTPVINMISISYLSSRRCEQGEDRFFRVSPSGVAGIEMGDLLFDDLILRRPAGVLFVGVADSVPGQDLSLLFRLAEGTGTTDKTPPGITWRYLSGNEWRKLPDECLVSDSTYGLQATGILQIAVPPDEKQNSRLFGLSGLHWISASVEKDTDAFP
ncbi:MAG TPA: hypothetical protein VE035_18470, partial [Puia sp.]|nr:hypothetical protein [Puia sp.]